MSKYISELLGAVEPVFGMAISQMELASGNPSVDVRLTAEIIGKAHMKTKALGLDPVDTTGKELQAALINLIERHDHFLAKRLGGNDPTDVEDMLARIKLVVDRLGISKQAWVLKHSVAKRLLKNNPPKNLMKALGYRSIDSMLKREPISELFGAVRFMESAKWLNGFLGTYWQLRPSDFESRDIEVVHMDPKKWGKHAEPFVMRAKHNITHLKEMGAVIMLPMPIKHFEGVTITVMPLVLHYINEIRL
jgi:hypothetical protein